MRKDFENPSKASGNIQKVCSGGNGKRSKSIKYSYVSYIYHIEHILYSWDTSGRR